MRITYDKDIERYTTAAPPPLCRISELTCLPADAWQDADGVGPGGRLWNREIFFTHSL